MGNVLKASSEFIMRGFGGGRLGALDASGTWRIYDTEACG
jgi:hypothetical protein